MEEIFKGAAANDKTGTTARIAADIINENFAYLDAKISNVNRVVTVGTFVLVGQNLTIHAGWVWQINGVNYTNPLDVVINFPYSTTGKQRLDRVVLNTSNTFTKVVGTESVSNPIAEPVPADTIDFGISLVTDNSVGDPSAPIIGDVYVQKNESQDYVVSYGAATVVEQINLIDNRLSVSITGAVTDVKSIRLSNEFIRPGKPHYFKNRTNHNVKIWHNAGTGNIKYFFPNSADFVVKTGEVIEFNLNSNDSTAIKFEFVGIIITDLLTQTTDQNVSGLKTFLAGKFGLRNIANTFTSLFTNSNTASRTYTLQNRDGTLLDNTDLSTINSSLATKQTVFAGLSNYIVKSFNATTLLPSRLMDNGTSFGIGTVNLPTKDITLGKQENRDIGVEQSDSSSPGRDLTIEAGRTINYIDNADFNSIASIGVVRGLAVDTNSGVYAAINNGDIYKQAGGTGGFTALSQTSRAWGNMAAASNGDIYATVIGGDIYKRTAGVGNFIALSQTLRAWSGICVAPNGDVYATVSGGDIYKQTGGAGNFVALAQTVRAWRGICAAPNGDIYVVVNNGDIYKQTGGAGNFVGIGAVIRDWTAITINGSNNLYASTNAGDIYKQVNLLGVFTLVVANLSTNFLYQMASAPNTNVYACSGWTGQIYMQQNDALGVANLDGGTLIHAAGTGKGIGKSRWQLWTGNKTLSGTDMQILTKRLEVDELGNIIVKTPKVYADNSSAIAAGLETGTLYWTSSGDMKIVV